MERDRVIYVCNDWPCALLPLWMLHYASEGLSINTILDKKRQQQMDSHSVWQKHRLLCHRWKDDADYLELNRDLCEEISEAMTTLSTVVREDKETVMCDPDSRHLRTPSVQNGGYQVSDSVQLSIAEGRWRAWHKERIAQAKSVFLIHNAEFTGPDLSQSLTRLALDHDFSSILTSKSVWLCQAFIPESVITYRSGELVGDRTLYEQFCLDGESGLCKRAADEIRKRFL